MYIDERFPTGGIARDLVVATQRPTEPVRFRCRRYSPDERKSREEGAGRAFGTTHHFRANDALDILRGFFFAPERISFFGGVP
jgi:hypothetical protein